MCPFFPKLISTLRSHGVEISMAFTYADAEKSISGSFPPGIMIEELFDIERFANGDSYHPPA